MISTVEILSGSANIGRYQNIQKPPGMAEKQFLTSPLFYSEPTFFAAAAAMSNEQHKHSLSNGMDSFLRPKPKQDLTIMKSLQHFPAMDHHHATCNSQIQKDPVNLAIFSSRDFHDDNSDQREIDVVGLDNNNSYTSSLPAILRVPKASYPKISDSAYHHFNFNNFATSAAAAAESYSSHLYSQLSNHPLMSQLDFRSYLPPNSKSFPATANNRQSMHVNDLISSSTPPQNLQSPAADFSQSAINYTASAGNSSVEFQPSYHGINKNCSDSGGSSVHKSSAAKNHFKIPTSGKESTLKHRILSNSRPQKNNISSNHQDDNGCLAESDNELINFIRGSMIELSNGTLRKVEELRTEDFVMSAEKSDSLQIEDSTVVRIQPPSNSSNCVIITFSYENNKSKIDIEARVYHPFFVYGQGWKSFDPQESFKCLKLECQKLQVGDICLSLTPRKLNNSLNLSLKNSSASSLWSSYNQQHLKKPPSYFSEVNPDFKDDYDDYRKRRWSASELENAYKKTKLGAT